MKKLIVTLWLLAAGWGAVFAQLSFSGEIGTGLGIRSNSDNDDEKVTELVPFSKSRERYLGQFRLNAAYTNEEKNLGANFRFQLRDRGIVPTIPFFYGWANLFSNILQIKGGLVDDGVYNMDARIIDDDLGEGLGALFHIRPLEGKETDQTKNKDGPPALSLGMGWYVGKASPNLAETAITTAGITNASSSASQKFAELDKAKYTVQAAFLLPSAFKAVGGYRNEVKKWDSDKKKWTRDENSKVELEVMWLGTPNLTANLIFVADNLGDGFFYDKDEDKIKKGEGILNFYGVLGYKVNDALNVGLEFGLFTQQRDDLHEESDGNHTTTAFIGDLWGSYGLMENKIVPELHLLYGYGTYGQSVSYTGVIEGWQRRYALSDTTDLGGTNKFPLPDGSGSGSGYDDRRSFFSVRPAVAFNLSKNVSIEIGDLLHFSINSEERWNKDDKEKYQDNILVNNAAYIDFWWRF